MPRRKSFGVGAVRLIFPEFGGTNGAVWTHHQYIHDVLMEIITLNDVMTLIGTWCISDTGRRLAPEHINENLLDVQSTSYYH